MSDALNDMLKQSQEVAATAADEAQEAGRRSAKTLRDAADRARESASDAYDSVIEYTQDHPVQALAIAVGAGALIAALIGALLPPRD